MSPISDAPPRDVAEEVGTRRAPAGSGILVVRDAEALCWRELRGVRAVRLEIAGIDAEERRRRESAINQALRACGCELGAVAGGVAAICGAAWLIWHAGGPLVVPWPGWLVWFVATGAALGAGKTFGRWLARRRLAREIATLREIAMRRESKL